ncbi:hypothetical protein GCM10027082_41840 [Comamonas humi]
MTTESSTPSNAPRQPRPQRNQDRAPSNSAMADALKLATQGTALETRAAEPAPEAPRQAPRNEPRGERRPERRNEGRSDQRRPRAAAKAAPQQPKAPPRPRHPVVEKLAGLYPALFGEQPLPLKRGIYQDLLAAHTDAFDKAELKVALGLHTRSTRYLNAVSMGQPRHDLQGQVVEAMAPEHVFHALVEAFRRRKPRDGEDLQIKLRRRMGIAFMASGLSREAFLEKVQVRDEATQALLDAALQEVAEFDAKAEALARAYAASGKSVAEFADMYGMHPGAVQRHLERAAQLEQIAQAPVPAPVAAPADGEAAAAE